MNTLKPLETIADWPLEARDDSDRLFFENRFSDAIADGRKIFVIGRKGTGKTAICEHIENLQRPNKYSILQSFKNFPFNEIYEHEDTKFTKPNQYITIWKYTILTAICRLMLENKRIDSAARDKLSKIFDFELEDAFALKLRKITDRNLEFSILGSGIATGPGGPKDSIGATLDARCQVIQKFILQHIDDAQYFILFDELDEDYRGVVINKDEAGKYLQLLVSLFKAVQELHGLFQKKNKNIYPVVFLRDDIFDLLRDHDKPKWSDKSIDLNWDSVMLKELIIYRLRKTFDIDLDLNYDFVWNQMFSVNRTRINKKNRGSIETFVYLLKSTYMRPRDLISYIRECAKIATSEGKNKVNNLMIKKAEVRHSEFMRSELISEMYSIIPEIAEILDMFSEIRKPIISRKEFNDNYRNLQKRIIGEKAGLAESHVLEILYYFGAIGNVTRAAHQIYKYNSPRSKFNRSENICIHRSLLKSIDVY